METILRRILLDSIIAILVFAVGFLTGHKYAKRIILNKEIEAINNLRKQEIQIRDSYDEIIKNLTEQQNAITFQSTYLRDDVKQLRNSTDKVQSYITAQCPDYSKTPFAELFIRCTEQYTIMAESAERHATDAENTVKAWNDIKNNIINDTNK